MALTGIQIFKMTPKKNCKECGSPTCMAFSMKVAQGAVDISACPYMSEDALAQLSEATAPPMKTIKIGTRKIYPGCIPAGCLFIRFSFEQCKY